MSEEPLVTARKSTRIFDIVIVANVTRKSDIGLRIRREIEVYSDMGYRVGIRHIPKDNSRAAPLPDIQFCVTNGLAEIVPPHQPTKAKLVLVFSPGRIDKFVDGFDTIQAKRVVLIIDSLPKLPQMGLWHCFYTAKISWAPTNRWIRAALLKLNLPVPLEPLDWRSIARSVPHLQRGELKERPMVVGRFSASGAAQWPEIKRKLIATYGLKDDYEFMFVGDPSKSLMPHCKARNNWTRLDFESMSAERFVQLLDAVAYFPSADYPELPESFIATAMASGKPVFLPPRFRPHFGEGAIYCTSPELKAHIKRLFGDEQVLEETQAEAIRQSGFHFSEEALRERVAALVGPPPKRRPKPLRRPHPPRVLFVPSNGVGLGHVTRTLAIARRMDHAVDPVFATLAQGSGAIEASGYTAEYLPSHTDTGENLENWDKWFQFQLAELIDRYGTDTVVFDGNNPTHGLVRAAGERAGCKLIWVRRGMLGKTVSPYMKNARFMDLIIEPGEVAGERDIGATVQRRGEALLVEPITLLDRHELLSAEQARVALGLAPDLPAVLVQLGAGTNRDTLSLIEQIMVQLRKIAGLQIIVVEWQNGLVQMPAWPDTKVLRGFPNSRFFNAFNFSVSAAGYNTYHEVMASGLPTIFLANRHPQMDDQWARAQFAQDKQTGFNLSEDELFHIPALCDAMLNETLHGIMRDNALALSAGNGAATAASAILELTRLA